MSKDTSAKYYQNNKERPKKCHAKNIEAIPKKEKQKSANMGAKKIKISLKIKNKK